MALIHGMPMIGHCYCRVRLCEALEDTYVATCDREIYEYIESVGGKAIMTADTHERAVLSRWHPLPADHDVSGRRA